MNSLLEKTVKL